MLTVADLLDLNDTIAADLFAGKTYPWEALEEIGDYIRRLGPTLPPEEFDHPAEDVWIAKDAKVFPSAYIVGKKAVVGNSVELKNVVLFDYVQTPHYNYVGDSILGSHAHMGAGSITSNVKSDKTLVVIREGTEQVPTGRKKVGAILGNYVEVGCNSVLNPGTVIGPHSNVYPTSSVRGTIPPHHIYKNEHTILPKK